jgi:hypothetical protein
MVDEPKWLEMKRHAFEAYTSDGRLDVHELESIVEIGNRDGGFTEDEKLVLINVIANLTRADMNDDMWAKVGELIHKFELEHDSDANIEGVAEEHEDDH